MSNGIVMPRRPIAEAITDAMQFLKKADGDYVPGRIDGDLAGYFSSVIVKADGTRSQYQLCYPARQDAYFIRTFLHYYAYTGEREWLLRARDLADWNLAHSTPADAAYPNLPYSSFEKGKPTGSADKNSIETDKPAFFGQAYLAVYETTADVRYLNAARKIARRLSCASAKTAVGRSECCRRMAASTRISARPVFFGRVSNACCAMTTSPHIVSPATKQPLYDYTECGAGAFGQLHETAGQRQGATSRESMSFRPPLPLRSAKIHPEYVEMGRRVLRQMKDPCPYDGARGGPGGPPPWPSRPGMTYHARSHGALLLGLVRPLRATHDAGREAACSLGAQRGHCTAGRDGSIPHLLL